MRTTEGIELDVWRALSEIHDPEIPPISIVDLGMVERVVVGADAVEVELLPTFAGCPALDVIRDDAEEAVRGVDGVRGVRVRFVYAPPWTIGRITAAGREALRSHGITPPSQGGAFVPLAALTRDGWTVTCPFCGSDQTVLESAFGPTLCRRTHFCRACRNPFEGFKSKGAKG